MHYLFLFLVLIFFPTQGYSFDQEKFKAVISEAIDLTESAVETYQDSQSYNEALWNDRGNRNGIFDAFYDEVNREIGTEKRIAVHVSLAVF